MDEISRIIFTVNDEHPLLQEYGYVGCVFQPRAPVSTGKIFPSGYRKRGVDGAVLISAALLAEKGVGVDALPASQYLEVEMRAGRAARVAADCDELALLHVLPYPHNDT
jgi:hypothetical protein